MYAVVVAVLFVQVVEEANDADEEVAANDVDDDACVEALEMVVVVKRQAMVASLSEQMECYLALMREEVAAVEVVVINDALNRRLHSSNPSN